MRSLIESKGHSMVQFLVKRFIGLIFVIIGVTFITFILGYFAPGDPIKGLLGNHFILSLYLRLRHQYGLDLPWYQQYWIYLTHLFRLDFGYSYKDQGRPVWDILKDGVPITAELGLWALLLQIVVGVPLGIISALKANTWIDTSTMGTMLVFFAVPSFVLTVFVEQLFNIPGIAQASISSISDRDYPVIQATTVLLAVMVVLGNLLSDILYAVVDPRIKVQ